MVYLDPVVVMNARVISEFPSPKPLSLVYSLVGILGDSDTPVFIPLL
jgi:hypothetical protein